METRKYDAVLFDLLTALLDSWTLWNSVAGGDEQGLRWRREYLRLTYEAGAYRPYEEIVEEAAREAQMPDGVADELVRRWDELSPWSEVPEVLDELRRRGVPMGVVTNCSEELGARAAARAGADFRVVATAERAGWYKPDPRPYQLALRDLGVPPERVLFVAGSPSDVPGASGVGMPVVWHNRVGLPPKDADTQPLATYPTLEPLVAEFFGGGEGRRTAKAKDRGEKHAPPAPDKRLVRPEGTPPPRGAYSPGLVVGDLVFVAGQSARDGELNVVGGTIEEQTALTLENVKGVLKEAGATMSDVVKATVHLSDLALFGRYDEVYARYFPDPKPVRTTVGSVLAPGVLVEIDVIASRDSGAPV